MFFSLVNTKTNGQVLPRQKLPDFVCIGHSRRFAELHIWNANSSEIFSMAREKTTDDIFYDDVEPKIFIRLYIDLNKHRYFLSSGIGVIRKL